MNHASEYLFSILKSARLSLGLTQRELSTKVKIPQSHISKIEQGDVDLHISSLVEIARSLDLEVMLVPRPLVPIVKGLQNKNDNQTPLYQLDKEL